LDGIDFAEAKEKEQASSLNFFYESLNISDHQQRWPCPFPGPSSNSQALLVAADFDKRAFQTAAQNNEDKPEPSRQPRRKTKATPPVDSQTWFPACHLFSLPNYVWLNRRDLFIDNSGSLFLGPFRTNDLQAGHR
jgi:hypothetical protein